MSASAATTTTARGRGHLRLRSAREFWGKFSKRRPGVAGVVVLIVFSILAIAPAFFVGPLQTVTTAPGAHLEPPSLEFPMGTDALGRSVLNLTVWGTRISMVIGLLATIITVVLGALVGIVSVRRWADRSGLMRIATCSCCRPSSGPRPRAYHPRDRRARRRGSRDPRHACRHRDRDRHHKLGVDRARHPQPGPVGEGALVRRSGAGDRRRGRPHHAPPPPAERHQPHHRQHRPGLRRGRADRDDPRIRRARRPSSRRGARSSTTPRRSAPRA